MIASPLPSPQVPQLSINSCTQFSTTSINSSARPGGEPTVRMAAAVAPPPPRVRENKPAVRSTTMSEKIPTTNLLLYHVEHKSILDRVVHHHPVSAHQQSRTIHRDIRTAESFLHETTFARPVHPGRTLPCHAKIWVLPWIARARISEYSARYQR